MKSLREIRKIHELLAKKLGRLKCGLCPAAAIRQQKSKDVLKTKSYPAKR
jgi:hypothetical protein